MIIGKRIRLRAIEPDDINLFVPWLNDPEIRQHLELYLPISMGFEEQWVTNIMKQPLVEQPLVIEVNTPDGWVTIGNTSFMDINWRDRKAEVGIFIGDKRFHNQGYGTEAMSLMVELGFNHLNLERITLRVHSTNPRALKCYLNVGFVQEGVLRQDRYINGKYIDVICMGILKSEWKEKQIS